MTHNISSYNFSILSFTITGANTFSPKPLEYSAIFLQSSGDSINLRSCMVRASASSNGKERLFFPLFNHIRKTTYRSCYHSNTSCLGFQYHPTASHHILFGFVYQAIHNDTSPKKASSSSGAAHSPRLHHSVRKSRPLILLSFILSKLQDSSTPA